jgi:predicted nucleic acid-binding protein
MTPAHAILPDTSIWVAHFRFADVNLQEVLRAGRVRIHPFVVSELALGSLVNRTRTLADLRSLPQSPVAEQFEVDRLIENRRLFSRGIGFVDLHLIASALLDGNTAVWTLDKRFGEVAEELGLRTQVK